MAPLQIHGINMLKHHAQLRLIIFLTVLCFANWPASAQRPTFKSWSEDVREREYADVKSDLIAAVERMPEEFFSFRAAPEIRTFGEEIAHAAAVNDRQCLWAQGDRSAPTDGAGDEPTKASLLAWLRRSFARCDSVLTAFTDEEGLLPTFNHYVRASHVIAMVGHTSQVYGKVALLLRLKGIVPPS